VVSAQSSALEEKINELKKTAEQQRAIEQQLRAANQQLKASEQQLMASNQQLRASQQQLKAANQQLLANEKTLTAEIEGRRKLEEEMRRRLHELEVFQRSSVGREERIMELKKKIDELTRKGNAA
jgi:chromosome segregation ATPase